MRWGSRPAHLSCRCPQHPSPQGAIWQTTSIRAYLQRRNYFAFPSPIATKGYQVLFLPFSPIDHQLKCVDPNAVKCCKILDCPPAGSSRFINIR